jgi:hypothetical protein
MSATGTNGAKPVAEDAIPDCPDCGVQGGHRYTIDGVSVCWPCWNRRQTEHDAPILEAELVDKLAEIVDPQRRFPPLSSTRSLSWPRPLEEAAYCGLAGDVVREVIPHTEADPAAVLASVLVMFGNAVGRGPHFLAGDAQHATNIFVAVVGDTSSGRKGTSAEGARRLLAEADPSWKRCIGSGLGSGEGVIHHVRDARIERRKAKTIEEKTEADDEGFIEDTVDNGVDDKRLMVLVPEFAQVLGVISRKDNTLSAVLRELWDRGDAQTMTKNSPTRATGALVSLLAHITPEELRSRLDSTEIANGFANRFLFIAAKRSKLLPRGGSIPGSTIAALALGLQDAIAHARRLEAMDMSASAWELWDTRYEELTTRPPTLSGAVTGRAAPMVRRLAMIYALMDERAQVEEQHLVAALELWRYAEESAAYVFGDRLGNDLADRCLTLLRGAGAEGLTRTGLRGELGNRIPADQISDALALLERAGLARHVDEPTGGRSAERWYAVLSTAGEYEGHRTSSNGAFA